MIVDDIENEYWINETTLHKQGYKVFVFAFIT